MEGYDPDVNVMPMMAVIKKFGVKCEEDHPEGTMPKYGFKSKHKKGDYEIGFGRLMAACADGMHMDSLNGTLKRAAGKSRDSPYKKENQKIKFVGKMLMLPLNYDAVIRMNAKWVPTDEEVSNSKTACGKGIEHAREGLISNNLSVEPCLGLKGKGTGASGFQ